MADFVATFPGVKVKRVTQFGRPAIMFICPGCEIPHVIPVRPDDAIPDGDPRATWRFNGSLDRPTLDPSVDVTFPRIKENQRVMGKCHFNLTNGRIHFFGDSDHKLTGASVDLKEVE